jgi:hypothetical protein
MSVALLGRHALAEPNVSLKDLLDEARSMEAAERQVKAIKNGPQPTFASVRRSLYIGRQRHSRHHFGTTTQTRPSKSVETAEARIHIHVDELRVRGTQHKCRGSGKLLHFQRVHVFKNAASTDCRLPPLKARQHAAAAAGIKTDKNRSDVR